MSAGGKDGPLRSADGVLVFVALATDTTGVCHAMRWILRREIGVKLSESWGLDGPVSVGVGVGGCL